MSKGNRTRDTKEPAASSDDALMHLQSQLLEAETICRDRLSQIEALTGNLEKSEKNYKSLFEQMPRGMQEEDYSEVKKAVDRLRKEGVTDLERYFLEHPEELREIAASVKITLANRALLKIHREKSIDSFFESEANIDSWWSEAWEKHFAAEIAALAGPERRYEDEHADWRADGSYFETRSITTIVEGYEHSWDKVITIFEDVTQRKANQTALIEARKIEARSGQTKIDYLLGMINELHDPLIAFRDFQAQAIRSDRRPEDLNDLVSRLNQAGQQLLTLVNETSDFSPAIPVDMELMIEPVSISRVIDHCLSRVTGLVENQSVKLHIDSPSFRGLRVLADEIKLRRVFRKLLTNVVIYNKPEGRVELTCEKDDRGQIRIGFCDNGPGMTSKQLEELFSQPLEVAGKQTSGAGRGVSLLMARQYVQMMQGRLEVESNPGKGTCFWVELKLESI